MSISDAATAPIPAVDGSSSSTKCKPPRVVELERAITADGKVYGSCIFNTRPDRVLVYGYFGMALFDVLRGSTLQLYATGQCVESAVLSRDETKCYASVTTYLTVYDIESGRQIILGGSFLPNVRNLTAYWPCGADDDGGDCAGGVLAASTNGNSSIGLFNTLSFSTRGNALPVHDDGTGLACTVAPTTINKLLFTTTGLLGAALHNGQAKVYTLQARQREREFQAGWKTTISEVLLDPKCSVTFDNHGAYHCNTLAFSADCRQLVTGSIARSQQTIVSIYCLVTKQPLSAFWSEGKVKYSSVSGVAFLSPANSFPLVFWAAANVSHCCDIHLGIPQLGCMHRSVNWTRQQHDGVSLLGDAETVISQDGTRIVDSARWSKHFEVMRLELNQL